MKNIIKTITDNKLLLEISQEIYDKIAMLNAAYKFTNLCYIHIDPIKKNIVGVYFTPQSEKNVNLDEIANKFCNELIDQQLRLINEKEYKVIREEIIKEAFHPVIKKV